MVQLRMAHGVYPYVGVDFSDASHALFEKYCERFEGPVTGKMKAQYFKDGEKWWEYTTQILFALVRST